MSNIIPFPSPPKRVVPDPYLAYRFLDWLDVQPEAQLLDPVEVHEAARRLIIYHRE